MSRPSLDVDHFRARVLQDALNEALPGYWEHRADTFARVGTLTAAATERACRRHAWLLRRDGIPTAVLRELAAVLEETALKETA